VAAIPSLYFSYPSRQRWYEKYRLVTQGGFGGFRQHWFGDHWNAAAIYGLTHIWNKTAYQSTQGLWKQSQAVSGPSADDNRFAFRPRVNF